MIGEIFPNMLNIQLKMIRSFSDIRSPKKERILLKNMKEKSSGKLLEMQKYEDALQISTPKVLWNIDINRSFSFILGIIC